MSGFSTVHSDAYRAYLSEAKSALDTSLPAQLRRLAKKWREKHENHAAGLMERAADELDTR